ncbi:MAG: hypothetical protein ACK5JN_23655 [Kluyvera sp.]|uniref:helix-turn-helix transcriptional regulator n=1 Tax=Kluyvera sp. TaxID=1538228 RepID=UPI003A8672AE
MRSDDYVRTEHADFWLSDNYLRWGLESLFTQNSLAKDSIHYVFLTEQRYSEVRQQNYNLSNTRIILLTDGSRFQFLNDMAIYQFPIKSSIEELQQFIISISSQKEPLRHYKAPVSLNQRERLLIDLIKQGKRMADMGELLNLHIKTVYQTRQSLMKKMGCSGAADLMHKLHSDIFKSWLAESHQLH